MGLADEIEALADDAYHYNATTADWERFRSRLTEIEQELAALRFFAELGARAAQALPPFALPCTSEYVNAQTGYTGETGG